MPKLKFIDKGYIDYAEAFDFQTQLFDEKIMKKKAGQKPDNHVLWCEHPHVYTLGNSGDQNNLLVNEAFLKSINAVYHKTNRGGDITYHGPGQIVVYPIIDLEQFKIGVKDYIYVLEDSICELIKPFGLNGQIKKGASGVWLDVGTAGERKICAVGVKVSRAITMHGLAFNANTDLSYFEHINPCGFSSKSATSLQKEIDKFVNVSELKLRLEKILVQSFNAKEKPAKQFA